MRSHRQKGRTVRVGLHEQTDGGAVKSAGKTNSVAALMQTDNTKVSHVLKVLTAKVYKMIG